MAIRIIVGVRLSNAGLESMGGGGEPAAHPYLARARELTSRAEALGAQLVAWGATTIAFAWEPDAVEEAIAFATALKEETVQGELAWSCGVAEGEMEGLAIEGAARSSPSRATLAWGPPLVVATSLARIAAAGEVLVDGDVRAVRVGELTTLGTRASTDAGRRVRGWKLDLGRPWRRPSTARMQRVLGTPPPPTTDVDRTDEFLVPSIERAVEALSLADGEPPARSEPPPEGPPPMPENGHAPHGSVLHRLRAMAKDARGEGTKTILALRRERTRLEEAPPAARCQSSLALAVALSLAGREDEALLDAMDALARAREASDARAEYACIAFLAKLFVASGHVEAAAKLGARRR